MSGAERPARFRPWAAVFAGVVVGALLACGVVLAWPALVARSAAGDAAPQREDLRVALFRATDAAREIVLLRAGPDANGERALSSSLFPGEEPVREIASVLLRNAGAEQPWEVDLTGTPLRARVADEAPWQDLEPLPPERGTALPAALGLRFRALAGSGARTVVEPRSMRRVLVALPPGRTIEDLSDVQWGERSLVRELLDVETLHALRDPEADVAARNGRRE